MFHEESVSLSGFLGHVAGFTTSLIIHIIIINIFFALK